MQEFLFATEHFRLSSTELHLLRSNFPYKKMPFNHISKVYIGKGISVKRPWLVLLFGLTLAISSLGTILYSTGLVQLLFTKAHLLSNPLQVSKATAGLIAMIGFLFVIGVISIQLATVKTWIMRVDYPDGNYDVLSLKKLISENKYFRLKYFVRNNFKGVKLEIDN